MPVIETEIVVAGTHLPSTLAEVDRAVAAAVPHHIKIVARNRAVEPVFGLCIGAAFASEEIEHLGVARLVEDRSHIRSRRRLDAVGYQRAKIGGGGVVEPGAEVFRLERPRAVVADQFQPHQILPGAGQQAAVGVDRIESARRAVADVTPAAEANLAVAEALCFSRDADVQQLPALILVDRQIDQPADGRAAAAVV